MRFFAALLAPLLALAQQTPPREAIGGVKELERSLGFEQKGSFVKSSEASAASYRCYYTGKLELPASYDDLHLKQGADCASALDASRYDVFYYPMEAVASGRTPLTAGLASSSLERVLVVVPHEDYHESKQAARLPTALAEAAATLVGFLTAGEYAREHYGADSEASRNLSREPELFLRKAILVNRYYEELHGLYADVRAHRRSADEALARKRGAFEELARECASIAPAPRTFGRCPGANNNAGLAFEYTYTRYYPLLYDVYRAQGQDFHATLEKLRQLPKREALDYLEAEAARARLTAETPH
jgi:hypothetical protein